jgi:hypothetical protein
VRLLLPLRSHAATWLLIPSVGLVALFSLVQPFTDVEGYWVGVASSSTIYCVFSCGMGALASAIDASRIRKSRVLDGANARSSISIILSMIWPTVVMSLLIQLTGFLMVAVGSWGSPGRFPWEVVVAWVAMIAFHMLLGLAVGLAFPVVFSAPIALLVSYVWIGFTWSVPYIPIRYFSGLALSGCCAVYADLAPNAVPSVVVFCGAGIVAGVLVLLSFGRIRRAGLAIRGLIVIVVLSVGAAVSLGLASDLGPYPSPPRSAKELACKTNKNLRICFFPEQLWNVSPSPLALVDDAVSKFSAAGLPVPLVVTSSLLDNRVGTVVMLYRRDFATESTLHSFSYGYATSDLAQCQADEPTLAARELAVQVTTGFAYFVASGGSSDPFVTDPIVISSIDQLRRLSPKDQASWISAAISAGSDCSTDVPEIPKP